MPLPETAANTPSDAQIVRAVRLGDVDAFARLVDRHHARCLRVATHLLGDADDADDAVQDAFVRAYRHLGSYREQDRFGAWFLRIVVNQCRSRATRDARYTPFDAERHEGEIATNAEPDVGERRAELAHALAQLGPAQREALVLRFAEELSYEEISILTGVGISALKMRVQRACIRMRTLLAEHLHR
ncbi:MAG: RNA polymerase sigma factor [Gemmatimonadaceae bacterium]|nr:RNA polymerase sigma factor [Gemmatimonadaceae bacterium]